MDFLRSPRLQSYGCLPVQGRGQEGTLACKDVWFIGQMGRGDGRQVDGPTNNDHDETAVGLNIGKMVRFESKIDVDSR